MAGVVCVDGFLPGFLFAVYTPAGVSFVKHENFISLHALKSKQNDGAIELQINGFRGLEPVGIFDNCLPRGTFS